VRGHITCLLPLPRQCILEYVPPASALTPLRHADSIRGIHHSDFARELAPAEPQQLLAAPAPASPGSPLSPMSPASRGWMSSLRRTISMMTRSTLQVR